VTENNGAVSLSWTGIAGALSYRVYRGDTEGGESEYQTVAGDTTTFVDHGAHGTSATLPTTSDVVDQETTITPLAWNASAAEVQAALELGLTTVKFFPAGTSGGAAAIKALAAPFGGIMFVPTGGVGPGNLAQYLSLPAVAAVGGSWMVPRDRVKAGDFAGIHQLTADAVALARARANS